MLSRLGVRSLLAVAWPTHVPIMEEFIEKVRSNPCLWDVNNLQYRDTARKDMVWESLSRESGLESGREAKLLWKRLRDSHREALRRRRTQGAQILKPWKYEELMEFTLPMNFNRDPETEPDAEQESETIEQTKTSPSTTQVPVFPSQKTFKECTLRVFEEKAKRRKLDTDEAVSRNSSVYSRHSSPGPSDAIMELFSSLGKKTQQLPRHLQLRVQREVFEAVTRAEEEDVLCFETESGTKGVKGERFSYVFKTSPASDTGRDEDDD